MFQLVYQLNYPEPVLDVPIIAYGGINEERVDEKFLREYVFFLLKLLYLSFSLLCLLSLGVCVYICIVVFSGFSPYTLWLQVGTADYQEGPLFRSHVQR